nr:hypothetical protein [Mesorhizobium sp. M7A.F.Ca.US.006.01.1.1]
MADPTDACARSIARRTVAYSEVKAVLQEIDFTIAEAEFRFQATWANGQPAVAIYARCHKESEWRAQSLHVIEPAAGGIASLTVYVGPLAAELFAAFGLPPMVHESWSEPKA